MSSCCMGCWCKVALLIAAYSGVLCVGLSRCLTGDGNDVGAGSGSTAGSLWCVTVGGCHAAGGSCIDVGDGAATELLLSMLSWYSVGCSGGCVILFSFPLYSYTAKWLINVQPRFNCLGSLSYQVFCNCCSRVVAIIHLLAIMNCAHRCGFHVAPTAASHHEKGVSLCGSSVFASFGCHCMLVRQSSFV